jgi:hypothetical protein
MSISTSDNNSEYQTDATSTESDSGNESRSQPDVLCNDGMSADEPVRPPEFYREHASRVNNTETPRFYADSTMRQLESVELQWRR